MSLKINKKNIVKWYIILYPLCDILYTLTSSLGMMINFNQMIRGFGLIFFLLIIRNKRNFYRTLGMILLLSLSFIMSKIFKFSISSITDLSFAMKICNNIILCYGFYDLYEKDVSFNEIVDWLIKSAYIVIASILLSYLGLGLESYGGSGRTGVKGFFTIQSTITLYLLLIMPLVFYKYKKLISVRMFLFVFSLFSIGSKTGVFATLLEYILFVFIDYTKYGKGGRLRKRQILQHMFLIVGGLTVGMYALRNYINYLVNLYNSKAYYYSLEAFILSNRNDQISWVEKVVGLEFNAKEKIIGKIFGFGYSGVAKIVKSYGYKFEAIERDFHGVYYYFGIVVLLLLCMYLLKGVVDAFKNLVNDKSQNGLNLIVVFLTVFGIAYAFLGGHLLYEAMNQLPYWSVVAFSMRMNNERKKNRYINIS